MNPHDNKNRERRRLEGVVVSHAMQNTAIVAIVHTRPHPKYLKYYKVTTRVKADNPANVYKTGDTVMIEETRPLSKEKRWRIIGKRAGDATPREETKSDSLTP